MKKQLKQLLCAALSISMAAASIVLPTAASADDEYTPIFEGDTVLNEWKFDFGSADDVAEGYTAVTPDMDFVNNTVDGTKFGFLGIDEEHYKLTNRYDGWTTQKGQVIELASGGGTGLNDAIGVVGAGGTGDYEGADIFGNKADEYYPTRFAMKVTDDTYYRVRATVTTLDNEKPATVSLYTERKHPIFKQKALAAGETYTVEFSVRVTPIYYEKSEPKGTIADEMLTVGVLGDNSALASLEIQQVESIPTVWVLGDSTVTDGNTTLPFFDLQNYTGVGTGLTLYLPRNYAMVNEGEGGLNAADSNHFNMVKSRIKEGDYMYVEYGHNHKSDGPTGYVSNLDKYYNACNSVGAKLIIVSPVQSVNSWNTETLKWNDRFGGDDNFEGAGRDYVAGKVEAGATDIAFANLTETSVAFVDKVTEDGGDVKTAAMFYYYCSSGGATDVSHPNDAGAENFAYCFFEALKDITDETQKAVIQPLLNGMTDETPNLISEDITAKGLASDAWPKYVVPSDEKYPILIDDVVFNEDGTINKVDVTVRAAEIEFNTYGAIVITIYDEDGNEKGKLYAINQVDNSTGYGSQTIDAFRGDVILEEGDTYEAVVVEADADVNPVEDGKTYSAVYKPTDIAKYLITDEDGEGPEDFDFFGATYGGDDASAITFGNGWASGGSAGMDLTLGEDSDGTKYANLLTDGVKNGTANQGSFYVWKNLSESIGTTGKYMISANLRYVSGSGMNVKLMYGVSSSSLWGSDGITAFTITTDGVITANGVEAGAISALQFTNVQWILDMDRGTATITVGGNDPVEYEVSNYATTGTTITPAQLTSLQFELNKAACAIQASEITVAQLKQSKLPEYKLAIAASNNEWGSVSIAPLPTEEPVVDDNNEATATDDPNGNDNNEATATDDPNGDDNNGTEAQLLSADGIEMAVVPGKATITSDVERTATLVEAVYENGTLKSVKTTQLTFTADTLEQTVEVAEGSKLMLWDSVEGMKPFVEAAVVPETTPTPEPTMPEDAESVTAELNTVVTISAEVNEGYVFMGWINFDTDETVSEDAEYTFRLREDLNLIAKFVKEPGIDDLASYTLTASSVFVSSAAGTTTTMKLVNPCDADGTPLLKITNTDGEWSSSDEGITVSADGVVTVGDSFSMGDAVEKTVTITGVFNGVTRTCDITFHSYTSVEDFSSVTDSWGFTTSGGVSVSDGVLNLLTASSANSSSVQEKTLDTNIAAATKVTVKFDWKSNIEVGKGRNAYFALMDASNNVVFMVRSDGSAGLSYSTTGVDSLTSFSSANQNWYTVNLTIDFTAKTINGTITETSTGTVKKTFTDEPLNESAASLSKFYATNTYSLAPLAIDNVCFKAY